jgi:thioredoxin-dependent peroxiredoxin
VTTCGNRYLSIVIVYVYICFFPSCDTFFVFIFRHAGSLLPARANSFSDYHFLGAGVQSLFTPQNKNQNEYNTNPYSIFVIHIKEVTMKKVSWFSYAVFSIFFSSLSTFGGNDMLTIGTIAPDFSLVSDKGDTIRLADFKDKNHVVLIFYPGDQTPGCTKQLCAIRDDYSLFEKKNTKVFGVNPADQKSHAAFVKKQGYQFPLLVDVDKKVAKEYGTDGMMIARTVYVINPKGSIIYAKRGLPPNSEMLDAIDEDMGK